MKKFIDIKIEDKWDPPYTDMRKKFMEINGNNKLHANFWLNNVTHHEEGGRYKWKPNLEVIYKEYPELAKGCSNIFIIFLREIVTVELPGILFEDKKGSNLDDHNR